MTETIFLQDRRLRQLEWLTRIPLALSAEVLAKAALPRLHGASALDRAFAGAELAAAALVVVVLVVAWRRRHGTPWAFGWIDVAAAAMLLAEWGDRLAHGGKWLSPVLLTAVFTLAVGLADRPLARLRKRRRVLRLDEEGLHFRFTRLRRFDVPWPEVASMERDGRTFRIRRRHGRERRIDLGRLDNRDHVARALATAAAARGISSRPESPNPPGP
jgi:hypothetical protein